MGSKTEGVAGAAVDESSSSSSPLSPPLVPRTFANGLGRGGWRDESERAAAAMFAAATAVLGVTGGRMRSLFLTGDRDLDLLVVYVVASTTGVDVVVGVASLARPRVVRGMPIPSCTRLANASILSIDSLFKSRWIFNTLGGGAYGFATTAASLCCIVKLVAVTGAPDGVAAFPVSPVRSIVTRDEGGGGGGARVVAVDFSDAAFAAATAAADDMGAVVVAVVLDRREDVLARPPPPGVL